ncbi:4-amino-4-deoxychorismate lyase [Glaciihabitans tibetensis]|uniref:4-amino-4-deoxychorismate lyase n=1 Tax=Glaciihabitans tibetensis TaxID=1266600 RepID=A0A2T0VA62_9MICO|nr:aminodeoxychorismate lyase [Glaciihabitans tibetensis]PRY67072.1 4-amino-4-deoxychorismate lyase [Glaciihabitans tibetensis]
MSTEMTHPAGTRVLILLDDPTGDDASRTLPLAAHLRQVDADDLHVSVLDLGVTRGDGIFETLDAVEGSPQSLEPHLARLANSARLLDLPAPSLDLYREAVHRAIALSPYPRISVKLVMTRGIEGAGACTGWVYAEEIPDFTAERENGIRVVTLDRGYRHDVAQTSPWLLQGAKTLSYAVNKSVYREAARRGADDVIFLSQDGYVLEGPTSSVILQFGQHFVTPSTDQGILAGTAQAAFFEFCEANGYTSEYRLVPADELAQADSIWLSSSVRQIVPVRELDGTARSFDAEVTAAALEHLLGRRS